MHPIERLRFIARSEDEPPAALAAEAAYTLADLSHYEPNAVLTACRRLLDKHPECGPLWWVGSQLVGAGDAFEVARRAGAQLCADPTSDRLAEALRKSFAASDILVFGLPAEAGTQALEKTRAKRVRLVGSDWTLRRAVRSVASNGIEDVAGYSAGEEAAALDGASVAVVEALAVGTARCLLSAASAALVEAAKIAEVPVWLVAGVGRVLPDPILQAILERSSRLDEPDVDLRAEPVALAAFALAISPDGAGRPAALAKSAPPVQSLELLRRPV